MTGIWRYFALCLFLLALGAFTSGRNSVTVYLVGDSTMADKRSTAFPETGWGTPFKTFFDATVVVENHARNGRSTRTFIGENRWQVVADALEEGDYVFIQFGHNDESKQKGDRYTSPDEYKNNLTRFVRETRGKGAVPVLLTPVTRRQFDEQGKVRETHKEYSPLVREVARETGAPFIDMDEKSRALLDSLGPETSRLLFLHLQPGGHPNYPDGKEDNTHFNELGARLMAQLVLRELANLRLELFERIINHEAFKGRID